LKAKVSDIHCDKKPVVTFNEVVTPAKDIPFSGKSNHYVRTDYYSGTSYFPLPNTGKLKSLTVTLDFDVTYYLYGNMYYDVVIYPIGGVRKWHRYNGKNIHYAFTGLNISVTQNQNSSVYIHGINWAQAPDFNITYTGVIEIPEQRHKEPHTTWQSSCPTL
jgi:hypothetical protein